jgi:ketosteroid isomerase-like protein
MGYKPKTPTNADLSNLIHRQAADQSEVNESVANKLLAIDAAVGEIAKLVRGVVADVDRNTEGLARVEEAISVRANGHDPRPVMVKTAPDIEKLLAPGSMYLADIVSEADEPAEVVQRKLDELIAADKVWKTDDVYPTYSLRNENYVGDDTAVPVLMDAIRRLISVEPTNQGELEEATGARTQRISDCLTRMQKTGEILKLENRNGSPYFRPEDQSPKARKARKAAYHRRVAKKKRDKEKRDKEKSGFRTPS